MKSLNNNLRFCTCTIGVLVILLILSACRQTAKGDAFSGCAYTEPEPIFSENTPGIERHSFQLGTQESTEQMEFGDGLNLSIRQSGCDHRKQQFEFQIPGSYTEKNADYWVKQTIRCLDGLSANWPGVCCLRTLVDSHCPFRKTDQAFRKYRNRRRLFSFPLTGFYLPIMPL